MSQEIYNWIFIGLGFGFLIICKMLHMLYRSLRKQIDIQQEMILRQENLIKQEVLPAAKVLSYHAQRAEALAKELEARL